MSVENQDPLDWKTKIYFKLALYADAYGILGGQLELPLKMVSDFTAGGPADKEQFDSTTTPNIFTIHKPHRYNFSFSIPANYIEAKKLMFIKELNLLFKFSFVDETENFKFTGDMFGGCSISDSEFNIDADGVSLVKFTCQAQYVIMTDEEIGKTYQFGQSMSY